MRWLVVMAMGMVLHRPLETCALNHCSITSCANVENGDCEYSMTFNFWEGNSVTRDPTYLADGRMVLPPDVCETGEGSTPGWEAFDGRCYGYSMGRWGVLNGEPSQADWATSENICAKAVYAADVSTLGGAHLTSVNSPRENCYIYEILPTHPNYVIRRNEIDSTSLPMFAFRDYHGFNDGNGCHSNYAGPLDKYWNRYSLGVCWLGLDQKAGAGSTSLAFGWNDFAVYDRRPHRNNGFTPWGGSYAASVCWDSTTGDYTSCPYGYEPNNVFGGTEDCVQIWDRVQSEGEWNDEPCAFLYPFVCSKLARCRPGFYRTQLYKGMPVRQDPSLVDFGVDTSYTTGLCTQCPAGTYHPQNAVLNYELSCFPCNPSRYGYPGERRSSCRATCPVGSYCGAGTGFDTIAACPAGTYQPLTGQSSVVSCRTTPAGFYSVRNATEYLPCSAGRCSGERDGITGCSNLCPAGYYCSGAIAGTSCFNVTSSVPTTAPPPKPCGANNLFAGPGQSACSGVDPGFYTNGGDSNTRTRQDVCPVGRYCTNGDVFLCPAGTFSNVTGAASSTACQNCTAGYYCPSGSTSPTQETCYLNSPIPNAVNKSRTYYCPAGTPVRLTVSSGYYTLPLTDLVGNVRSSQAPCGPTQVCVDGEAFDKVTWAPGTCNPWNIAENQISPNTGRAIQAQLQSSLTNYSVNYTLVSFTLAADLIPTLGGGPCDPQANPSPYSNNGIFALNSVTGSITVTRTSYFWWLNYEPFNGQMVKCPTVGSRYSLTVRATATGQSTVSTITCSIQVTVLDQNDVPTWSKEVGSTTYYRSVPQLSVVNTPVTRCDADGQAFYGWPVVHPANLPVEVTASDEDYFSVLRYSLVNGVGSALHYLSEADNPFKINSCSGLITMRNNRQLVYWDNPVFNFTVRVTDDGNGGRFAPRYADVIMIIYVTLTPVPPIMDNPAIVNFTVWENQPANFVVGKVNAIDRNIGAVLQFTLNSPVDGDAFYMDSNFTIRTTSTGSQGINFESTKLTYTVSVTAFDCVGGCPGQTATQSYTITVVNTNDPPRFQFVTPFYILENSTDLSPVCFDTSGVCASPSLQDRVQTNDVDGNPVNPSDVTVYSISPPSPIFDINPSTGQIYSKPGAQSLLNFANASYDDSTGTGRSISVTVRATSPGWGGPTGASAFKDQSYTIYLVPKNHAPVITYVPSYFAVETAPAGSLTDPEGWTASNFAITWSDPDNVIKFLKGQPYPQQTVTFSRPAIYHPTLNDSGTLFNVYNVPNNGGAGIALAGTLSYLRTPVGGLACGGNATVSTRCYIILIRATDNGLPPLSVDAWVTIRVVQVNSGPQYPAPLSVAFDVSEGISADAQQVSPGTFAATDLDNSVLVYTIVSGSGQNYFDLVPACGGGCFAVYKKANTSFVYASAQRVFTLDVSVTDLGSSKFIGRGCSFVNGNATGCDAGTRCSLKPGPFVNEYRCYEYCRPTANYTFIPRRDTYFCDYTQLTTGSNVPIGPAYQQFADNNLRIEIDISDWNNPPYIIGDNGLADGGVDCFVNSTVSYQKQNQNQVAIAALRGIDVDLVYAHAPFTFQATNPAATFWNWFTINNATGQIGIFPTVNATGQNVDKFLNLGDYFTASVTILDEYPHVPSAPRMNSTCSVGVLVIPFNTRPNFLPPSPVSLNEGTPVGTIVYTALASNFSAVDPDVLNNPADVLTFTMSNSPFFILNSTSSQLITAGQLLNYESLANSNFQAILVVRVSDSYGADDVAAITINVVDVNEAPVWSLTNINLNLPENSPSGFVVANLNQYAIDPDVYANGITTFKNTSFTILSGCSTGCPLALNATGSLAVKPSQVLDYEGTGAKSWTMVIRARDGGNTNMFNDATVIVSLTNVVEPPIIASNITLTVAEGSSGTFLTDLVTVITFIDAIDTVGSLQINITGGDPTGVFSIIQGKLYVSSNSTLDFENVRSYTLNITVTDPSLLSGTGTFNIIVTNINDVSVSAVSLVSGGLLSCSSTTKIRITGSNFGMVSRSPAATLVVSYARPASSADPSPPTRNATNCNVTIANTEIQCDVPAGAGQNFLFNVAIYVPGLIFGDSFLNFASTLRYNVPTIVNVTGVDLMPTLPPVSTTVVLSGTCFGAPGDLVSFGSNFAVSFSWIEFCDSLLTCTALTSPSCVVTSTTVITCTNALPSGLGASLRWRMKILGQTTVNPLFRGSYARPTLTATNLAIIPTTGTPPSPYFVFTGTNFGPLTAQPDSAYYVYQTTTYNLIGCTVTTAYKVMTCTSASPGLGVNMKAYVSFGSQLSTASTFNLSYALPTITSITGPGAVGSSTIGGQFVNLGGTNFGPVCGVPGASVTAGGVNCNFITATYTKGSISPTTHLQIIYTAFPCAVVGQLQIVCATVPGTGAGHTWTVRVGGQVATMVTTQTTSYSAPVVATYDGDGANHAKTDGGQLINIQGSNFGPLGGALVSGQYGNKDINPTEFTSPNCYVSIAHTTITCVLAQGAGAELSWVVVVDGILGRNELTDYGPPVLSNTSFDTSGYLNNDGNNVMTIIGLNFGPAGLPGPYLESAWVGPSSFPNAYATYCTVLDHTAMTCTVGAGSGINLKMVVTVRGQQSPLSAFALSYQPPDVTGGLFPIGAPKYTQGGAIYFIKGRGYSLCDITATTKIMWNEDPSVSGATNRVLAVSGKYDATGTVLNPSCPVGSYAQLSFIVPEMNVARRVLAYVQISSSAFGGSLQSSDFIEFFYDPPVLTSVFAESSSLNFGGVRVSIFGLNFCKSEACCQTYQDNVAVPTQDVVSHSHTKIVLELSRPGSLFVRCGTTSSNAISFTTNSPFVFGTVPQLDSVNFKPIGGETFEIWGLYFGDSAPIVTMAENYTLAVVAHDPVGCYDPGRPSTASSFAFDSSAQCYRTTVSTLALTGRLLPIAIVRGSTKSVPKDSRFEFLSYMLPVVANASGTALTNLLGSQGGATLVLSGMAFGVQQGQIIIGDPSDPISCTPIPGGWTDAQVTCIVGPGEGVELPIVVQQASGASVTTIYTISYLPPSNLDFDASVTHDTQGGSVFELYGQNFGRQNKSVVMVGGFLCSTIFSNSTYTECLFPEGEGFNLPVVLTSGGQSVTSAKKVMYAPPEIYSVSPSTQLPTAGGLTMYITGKNFGVNQLKLYFGAFVVAERYLDPDPTLNKDPFIYPGTNHTSLKLLLPPFFGARRLVKIMVRNQLSPSGANISFAAPTIGGVSVSLADGSFTSPFFTSTDFEFPPFAFNVSGPGLPPPFVSGRRLSRNSRRLDQTGYGAWTSTSFGPCESNVKALNVFWRSFAEVAPNGEFRRTFNHFSDGSCISTANQSFVVTVTGLVTDLGVFSPSSATAACGLSRLYSQATNAVTVTILTADALDQFIARCTCVNTWRIGVPLAVPQTCLSSTSACPLLANTYGVDYPPGLTRYGVYIISNDVDLYLSRTTATQAEIETAPAIKFPDQPTASVSSTTSNLVSNIPKGPTDGCFIWENIREYLDRAADTSKQLGIPASSVPRICSSKALLQISGTNFGVPLTTTQLASAPPGEPPSLRVFLVSDDPSVDPFEASTVASPGSHNQLCMPPECFQTQTMIRFWLPFGLGKSLRILVFVGDQSQFATTRFSYLPPTPQEVNPGTVRLGQKFQNSLGEQLIVRGINFGGRSTTSNVLISGRPCINSEWTDGTTTDADGRPYITCEAPLDVVGPKSVLLCVANQLSFQRLYRSDGPVLLAGEARDAWNNSKPYDTSFASQLASMTLTRCPAGTTGRLYELCVDCPVGAKCEDGSFSGPASAQYFFDYEIPTRNADGSVTDRATLLCQSTSWNDTLSLLYPDLVQRPTCNAFVGCEPKTACLGNSQCAVGYEYALPLCLVHRGYMNRTSFSQLTRAQVENTENACNVTLNPYTFEYEGVDADCMGGLPAGTTCSADQPQFCAKCTVFKEGTNSYFGACECTVPPRCSLCTIHEFFRLNNECQPCPQNPGLLIGGLFFAAFAVALIGWFLQREQVNLAFITIGIDYFQVLAIFASTKVPWPGALQSLFNIMSVFNFNIDITAPECITPNLSYEVKWWLQMALPLALAGVLLFIYISYAGVKMIRWGMFQAHVYQSHLSALIAIFIVAMYYLYLVLTKKALEIFNCNPVDPDDGFTYTAFTSLDCDGGGLCRCGVPGGPQMRLVPFATTFLVLYTFGYPAYIAFTLRRNALLVREDQYLRAHEVGYVRKTNPDCYDMRKRYSKLYYQFKPRFATFWILVLLVRKFWIAFAFILFRGNPAFQLAVVLLVLFVSIVFQVLWRPFLSTGDRPGIVRELDAMAERSIKEPVFRQYREIQARVQQCMTLDVEHRRRKKQVKQGAQLFTSFLADSGRNVGLTLAKRNEKVSRSVAAARWFTNLNTLEFILLGCGIIVCLSGIMFEAAARDNRALVRGQVDAITWIVVIIVIGSLVYYFLFFLAEVAPYGISYILTVCRKKRKEDDPDEYYDPNINLEENPMFAAPKVQFADNRALQSELEVNQAQLKLAEQQNKRLRDEIKNKKIEAQLDETAGMASTGLEDVKPRVQRKDFAQTRLNAVLVGPNRQRARGGTGKKGVVMDEDDDEEEYESKPNRRSVFGRVSVSFMRSPKSQPQRGGEE